MSSTGPPWFTIFMSVYMVYKDLSGCKFIIRESNMVVNIIIYSLVNWSKDHVFMLVR